MKMMKMVVIAAVVGLALASGADTVNLVANPGFEEGMAPWRYDGPEYAVEAGAGRGGGAALRFTNEDTGEVFTALGRELSDGGLRLRIDKPRQSLLLCFALDS